ncbi:MAG TPA: V-type ATP synthase subunit D [Thermoanaerobaculia bacterium]|nr:V-type ATP synthase subunit D [Thermoanaerobaculia bacterium]
MIGSAVRSRLYELRRDRQAAQRSADLLDRKREALLREILRRERLRAQLRASVDASYKNALFKLRIARVELGMNGIESASLAQMPAFALAQRASSVMGVRIVQVGGKFEAYRASYGAAATAESLDDAGAAFHALLPDLIQLAQEETAIRKLRFAMRKTTKIFNALRKVVLPRIEREIRATIEGIEEEERDEFTRREVWRQPHPLFARSSTSFAFFSQLESRTSLRSS